jgi:hypothetical protein
MVMRGTKDSLVLAVLKGRVGTQQCAEVVVVDLVLVLVDKVSPAVLACLALHLVLVDGRLGIVVGEFLLEVLVDFVVDLGQTQLGTGDLFENGPVGGHVLNSCRRQSATACLGQWQSGQDTPLTANCFSMSSKFSCCSAGRDMAIVLFVDRCS